MPTNTTRLDCSFAGFADRQHDHGHHHFEKAVRFLKIPVRIDDHRRHYYLYDCLGQRCGEYYNNYRCRLQTHFSINHYDFGILQKSTANPSLATGEPSQFSVFFWWTMGIALLTAALFISARMGIYQEVLYKRYGKYPREALYVTVSGAHTRRHTPSFHNILILPVAPAATSRLFFAVQQHLGASNHCRPNTAH